VPTIRSESAVQGEADLGNPEAIQAVLLGWQFLIDFLDPADHTRQARKFFRSK
jgi:hypothetical protein